MVNTYVKIFYIWTSSSGRESFKDFSILALVAILFGGAETFGQF